jgi:hypothetical protein
MSCSNLHSRRANIPFQKVDPIGRMTYAVIANIAIGTVLSAIAIRYLLKAQFVKPEQLGLNKPGLRTAAGMVQNFMGIVGVLAGLPNLEEYRQPMVPIYAFAAVSVAALAILVLLILKRVRMGYTTNL